MKVNHKEILNLLRIQNCLRQRKGTAQTDSYIPIVSQKTPFATPDNILTDINAIFSLLTIRCLKII